MSNIEKLQSAINKSITALSELSNILSEGVKEVQVQAQAPVKEIQTPVKKVQAVNQVETTPENSPTPNDEFSQLKEILYSDKWPDAVNKNLICDPNSQEDKIERGRGIVELMIEENLNGLKVLDFGCGEGQCAFVSTDYDTNLSVGYDIKTNSNWENYSKQNLLMTTDWSQVQANGPYDIIILFDVLDHCVEDNPTELLKKVNSVLSPNGKVYMRCHPWMSRHATHLYHDINKAYIHLVFNDEEIKELIPKSDFSEECIKINTPIATYNNHINKSGLKVQNRRDITEKSEPFFKIPLISNRIIKNTEFNDFPEFQMSMQFLDYCLIKE